MTRINTIKERSLFYDSLANHRVDNQMVWLTFARGQSQMSVTQGQQLTKNKHQLHSPQRNKMFYDIENRSTPTVMRA